MGQTKHSESHTEHTTPGPQLVTEPFTCVNVLAEVARVRESSEFQQGPGRINKMLVKHSGLRVALVVMKTGSQWKEHKTASRIAIQPVSGRLRFRMPDGEATISVGELLVLDSNVPHSVEALEDAAFLLTLS